MAEFEPQIVRIRVPASLWAIARYVLRTGKDAFSYSELEKAACGSPNPALADGLIERLENGLYKANIELARLYASLLPKVPIRGRRRKEVRTLRGCSSEERREAAELARAWLELASWAEAHAEDTEAPPKEIIKVLEAHGIEVQRAKMPNGAKVIIAKVLDYYIVMDKAMGRSTPKCVRYPQLGPNAWLCASTKNLLFSYFIPLASTRP